MSGRDPRDGLVECVVCGRPLVDGNHHCPPQTVSAKEGHARREEPYDRARTFSERLQEGYAMVRGGQ